MKGLNVLEGAVVVVTLLLACGAAQATDISGTISTTLTIFDNSRLVGNVTCTVTSAPCIQFGASHITLDLNGAILIGLGPLPGFQSGEIGIYTNGQSSVTIKGPGMVRLFRDTGIFVGLVSSPNQGAKNKVEGVTVLRNNRGITLSASDTVVEGNTMARNREEGILILAGNNNLVRRNEVGGNASVGISTLPPVPITGTVIEENSIVGNLFGVSLVPGVSGTVVRSNTALGNQAGDIGDGNTIGVTTYQNNLCEFSTGTGAAGVCPNIPRFAGHRND